MPLLKVSHKSSAKPGACWALMCDFGGISRFNPALKESHLLEGSQSSGLGAERHCTLKDGRGYIRERVVEWEDGRGYKIEVTGGTLPVGDVTASLFVEPTASGSVLWMEMRYLPKWGLAGQILDRVMMRSMMRRQMGKVLNGLAHTCEAARQAA